MRPSIAAFGIMACLLCMMVGIATVPVLARPYPAVTQYQSGMVSGPVGSVAVGMKDIPSDTLDFGFYTIRPDGEAYAVLGERWDWDSGAADPTEGWTAVDLTAQTGTFFRQVTSATWLAEGNGVPVPAMNGNGFILCGARKGSSDSLGWEGGAGYGNNWCQRLTSPTFTYDGSGSVDLQFAYFSQSAPGSDCTRVFIAAGSSRVEVTYPGISGTIGIDPAIGVITPAAFAATITNSNFGGGTETRSFAVVVEFASDGSWSDEDGGVNTWYGPFGMDDFGIGPANLLVGDPPAPPGTALACNFETGIQGWAPGVCPGAGSFLGIGEFWGYTVLDPCPCALSGNVVKLHDEFQRHPDGQHVMLYTPIIDRENDIPGGDYLSYNRVMADYDQYSDLPLANGVFYRDGWSYYPYENPNVPGMSIWSPRVGMETFYYAGDNPVCHAVRSIGTDWGLPVNTRRLRFIYELHASCAAFSQVPCSGATNFSPLIDNVRVRNVGRISAPVAIFRPGTKFQDGFGQYASGMISTADAGNADVVYNLRRLEPAPSRLGDSLVIEGPDPTSGDAATRWEAKLWFRLKRTGPGQAGNATYNTWSNAVAAAKGSFIGANANFAWGYMDSVESSLGVRANEFCSRFRDGPSAGGFMLPADPCYSWGGGGEMAPGNEILPDLCFAPGTKVEYFITTNYVPTPALCEYYPDTTGKGYYEFEILPSFRTVGGIDKFPCMLYIDACDGRGSPTAQYVIEHGLNVALNGLLASDPIPDPTKWDRYDYGDAASNWNGSFYRDSGGNAGATMYHMWGYTLVMVNTGALGRGCMEPRDWQGFQQWLEGAGCSSNLDRQGFIANGNGIAEIINSDYPSFLTRNLGATHVCRSYNESGCPPGETGNDLGYCTRLGQMEGYFYPGIPTDVRANWCPAEQSYGVIRANSAVPTSAGNKYYESLWTPGTRTEYAQVINDRLSAAEKYRTVLDGFSYDMLIARNPGGVPPLRSTECRYSTKEEATTAGIAAAAGELENAIRWTMGYLPAFCQAEECGILGDVPTDDGNAGALVNRLYQNRPNPFNPRTMIRFSLAADGPAKLVIYDVNGRGIRTLVDNALKAGIHEVTWDGADDAGRAVTSGVYWSRLHAGTYLSNRKLVVLK